MFARFFSLASVASVASVAGAASIATSLTALAACSSNPLAGGNPSDASADADASVPDAISDAVAEVADAPVDGSSSPVGTYSGVIAGAGGVSGAFSFTVSAPLGMDVPDDVGGVMDLPMLGGLLPISGALREDTFTLSLDATAPSGEVVCTGSFDTGPIYVVACKLGLSTLSGAYASVNVGATALCGTLSTSGSATPIGAFDLLVAGVSGYAVYGTTNDTIASGALPGNVTPAVASPVATALFPWGTGGAQVDLTVPDPSGGNGTWNTGPTLNGTFTVSSTACPSTAPPSAGSDAGAETSP